MLFSELNIISEECRKNNKPEVLLSGNDSGYNSLTRTNSMDQKKEEKESEKDNLLKSRYFFIL